MFFPFRIEFTKMFHKRKLIKDKNSEMESKRAKLIADMIHEDCVRGDVERVQNFLQKVRLDSEVIQQIDNNRSLHEITKTGSIAAVRQMLSFGVAINCLNSEGLSPLHIACQKRHAEVVEELLKNGANPNMKSSFSNTSPLHYVFEDDHDEDKRDINEKTISIINSLIRYGCDIDSETDDEESSLYLASLQGNISAVKLLLENGAKVNNMNDESRECSPIHAAADNGYLEIIELLANQKADLNEVGRDVMTPLENAAIEGRHNVVRKLLECGARVNHSILYENEETALHFACENGHLESVKELLKFGAKTDFPSEEIPSPIYKATENGHLEIVKELLKHGAKVDAFDFSTYQCATPLHLAAEYGNVGIVKELLKYGADVNETGVDCNTPLHKAIHTNLHSHYKESLVIIQLLLEQKSIDLNIKNEDKMTPLEKAIHIKDPNITRMITKKLCPTPNITDSIYPLKHFL